MARKHEHWLKAYMEYTAPLEAPDEFHFWAGVGTIAAALRGKTWMDMGYWKWKPNFFIIFVAPPGIANKSTTIGVGQELLRHCEGVFFAPDSATWQAVTDTFVDSIQKYTLPNGEEYADASLTIAAGELGTFLDPSNRELVDVLVDLWDGKSVPWKRRTRMDGLSEIPNPWVNLLGATTPAWMEGNFPEYAIRGGFTSRTIFVFANKKRHLDPYPVRSLTPERLALKESLITDLQEIAKIVGPYKLTEEAVEWGIKWYSEHWEGVQANDDRISGYLSRKQTHLHKLALILSAAQRDERVIQLEDMIFAKELLEAVEPEMMAALGGVSDDPRVKQQQIVLTAVKRFPDGIAKSALWRLLLNYMSEWHYQTAVSGLINAGLIRQRQQGADLILIPRAEDSE